MPYYKLSCNQDRTQLWQAPSCPTTMPLSHRFAPPQQTADALVFATTGLSKCIFKVVVLASSAMDFVDQVPLEF
ncbi:hypothetical protein J6590_042168 [Homalodisca vitripennis]|nr:hypothetical protein J6590_042168 [Homalodisca vitripennis]